MRSVLSWLGFTSDDAASNTDTIHRIAAELDRLPPDRARYIAAMAFVLSRVARADHEVSPDETAAMERLVAERNHLPADQAALVVQMAKTQQLLFGGTDDFLVTRELATMATYDQKLALIDWLYAVAAADRRILTGEADEIARIGRELKVDPADLSRLRSRHREFLAAREGLEPDAS
jgi:uncharacterized tellurite resistance protein B-like protein